MTAHTNPGRRPLLVGVAATTPSAVLAGDMSAAFTPDTLDARLVALAGELRQAEAHHTALVALEDPSAEAVERAASLRIVGLIGAIAGLPAAGLVGIASKAGRLCWSLEPKHGGSLMYCEDVLAESLAADLARLVPQAVGVNA